MKRILAILIPAYIACAWLLPAGVYALRATTKWPTTLSTCLTAGHGIFGVGLGFLVLAVTLYRAGEYLAEHIK